MRLSTLLAALFIFTISAQLSNAAEQAEVRLDGIVAIVNQDVILQSDLDTAVDVYAQRAQQRGQQLPDQTSFRRQVLSLLVERWVKIQEAALIGIRVDENELNDTLRRVAENNGQTLSEFRRALTTEGRDYRQVREEIRTEIITRRLYSRQVLDRINVSQQEVDDYLAEQAKSGQQKAGYTLQRILIGLSDGASTEEIQASGRQALILVDRLQAGEDFDSLAIQYSTASEALDGGLIGTLLPANMPSIYADAVAGQDIGTVSGPLRTTNGFHIIKIIDKSDFKQQKHLVKQFKARHILLEINAVRDELTTFKQLKKLRQRIELGDAFEDIAQAYSEDIHSAANGGELPWLNPGDMPRAFQDAIDGMRFGQLSEPVRTPSGWHIVELIERRKQDQTEVLMVSQAREAIRNRKALEEQESWLWRLREEAYIEYRIAELAPIAIP